MTTPLHTPTRESLRILRPRQIGAIRILLCLMLLSFTLGTTPSVQAANPIRALVVTGGHDFETNQFFKMFSENPRVTYRTLNHPHAQTAFQEEAAKDYDVIVFYDMWQDISESAKKDLLARVEEGKGLVALHHSLASYQSWPEYLRLIGGKYHLEKRMVNGKEIAGSTYKHDVEFKVKVADPKHHITQGVQDFTIHDETYGGLEVLPDAHVLLTTEEPTSTRELAWTAPRDRGRVVCIQLGHDHLAYENPNYRRLLAQAIDWASGSDH